MLTNCDFDPATKDIKFTGKDNLSADADIVIKDQDDTITLTNKSRNTNNKDDLSWSC